MTSPPPRCYRPGWHEPHDWVYGGATAHCDGLNTRTSDEPEPDTCRCGDPLCPCATKPGWGAYGFRRRRDELNEENE